MSIASLLNSWIRPNKATGKMTFLFLTATLLFLISCEVKTIDVQGHRGARGLRPSAPVALHASDHLTTRRPRSPTLLDLRSLLPRDCRCSQARGRCCPRGRSARRPGPPHGRNYGSGCRRRTRGVALPGGPGR